MIYKLRNLTLSVGIALYVSDARTYTELYKKADIGVDQAIIDGIKELYEEYKEITVVDFDEDLDEIEME